jgi:large repetitive protein
LVAITVNTKSADPVSASASATTLCPKESATLTLNGGGGGTGEVIRWYSGSCGGTLVGTGNNLVVTPTTTTTYFGRYEDGAPCNYNSNCQAVTVTIHPNPTADFKIDQLSECAKDSVSFNPFNVSADVTSYLWDFQDAPGSNATNPKHLFTTPGSYNVSLTVSTGAPLNCTSQVIHPVSVAASLDAPVVTFTGTTNTITFSWPRVPGAVTYQVSEDNGVTWLPVNGPDSLSYIISGLVPEQRKTIKVRAIGNFACQTSETGLILGQTYYPELGVFVPNTIAPDCNCTNNRLRVKGNYLRNVSIKVFNQWGQLLYSYNGTDIDNNGWDGTYKNTPQPAGVYAYAAIVVLRDGTVVKKEGLFNIIR